MARYRFRLQTLRRLREIHRDELRTRLAEAYEADRILAEQRSALEIEIAQMGDLQRRLVSGSSLDVNQLMASQRYRLALEAHSRVLAEQAAKLAEEVERRRQAVVEADRQVRVLDKLEERQRRQHMRAAAIVEMKRYDEIAATRWEAHDA